MPFSSLSEWILYGSIACALILLLLLCVWLLLRQYKFEKAWPVIIVRVMIFAVLFTLIFLTWFYFDLLINGICCH